MSAEDVQDEKQNYCKTVTVMITVL